MASSGRAAAGAQGAPAARGQGGRLLQLGRPAACRTRRRQCGVSVVAYRRDAIFLGIDFGTSGARQCVIDNDANVLSESTCEYASGCSLDQAWRSALWQLIAAVPEEQRRRVASVAVDGTSATALLIDGDTGACLAAPRLYDEAQPESAVRWARALVPPDHTVTAPTSTLCKVLAWTEEGAWQPHEAAGLEPAVVHQADWVAALLHGCWRVTDYNNALKLGYDPAQEAYPEWLCDQPFTNLLPLAVVAPGTPVDVVTPEAAAATGLPPDCIVCGGTTDSIAAFLAAGVTEVGEAVTSLGSTLAVKQLSAARVDDARYGLYSHRLGAAWLVGGASNSGGAVLRQHFSDAQLEALTPRLDPATPTGLDYYPLPRPGERCPVADPALAPRLEPRPADDAQFLQGMLEGVARIEARVYRLLAERGASPLARVVTAGGGARNPAWTAIRQRELGVPVSASARAEAAYGSALLARQGYAAAHPAGARGALVM